MHRPPCCTFLRALPFTIAMLVPGISEAGMAPRNIVEPPSPPGDADRRLIETFAGCPAARDGYVIRIGSTLCLFDALTQDTVEQVERLAAGIDLLVISSRGGNLLSAMAIADLARDNEWVTLVPARERCWSACVNILSAGRVRAADLTARVGVHYVVFNGHDSPPYTDPDATLASLNEISPVLARSYVEYVEKKQDGGLEFHDDHYPRLHDKEFEPHRLVEMGILDVLVRSNSYR